MPGVHVDAVTFDFWNTLCVEPVGHLRGRRLGAWAAILEDAGFAIERDHLDLVFETSWEVYVSQWKADQKYQAVEAAEEILDTLGFDVSPDVRAALLEA